MGTLFIQSKSLLNLTLKATSWMINFHTKETSYPLINAKRNAREEMTPPKFMTYMGYTRMGITTPTMDTLALENKLYKVQGIHGLEKCKSVGRISTEKE